MDSRLYIKRSENELKLASIIYKISKNPKIQRDTFDMADPETYYSATIAHSYYSIFYMARAYLSIKGIIITAPKEHKKTFEEFKKFVDNGELDVELLKIYQKAIIRAEVLLGILKEEKSKRGEFTYRTLPQANETPAQESIKNAQFFYKHIYAVLH